MKTLFLARPLALIVACLAGSACEPPGSDNRVDDLYIDSEAVRDAVMTRDDGELALLTQDGARESVAAPGSLIHVFASSPFADDYARIDPRSHGSEVDFPRGEMVVREIYSAEGDLEKITVIVRGEEDSNPGVGDLWFGVMTPDGEWSEDEDRVPQVGALGSCNGCHSGRQSDGWLFGLPR